MAGLVINDPVLFAAAIQGSNIIPGDIIQLADGIYKGDFTIRPEVSGLPGSPIKIIPRHPGKVVIDGTLAINGSYVEIYDIDFTDSRTDRYLVTNSITLNKPGSAIYGCSICDMHGYGGIRWSLAGPSEISENIIYNNGYFAEDGIGHGHAIYGQNNVGGLKTIARNLFFKQFGRYTIHLYSEGDIALKDFHCIDNIICDHPVHAGGGLGLSNFLYEGNIQYGAYCQLGRYSINQDATIVNNSFIQLAYNSLKLYDFQTVFAENNAVYDCPYWDWDNYSIGYTKFPLPPTLTRIITFSKSKRWLGAVVIFNQFNSETVAVDFSSLLSFGSYRLRNGQNISETWEFDYTGGLVNVPTNWTSAPRIGGDATTPTWPVFGGLVIEKK